MQFVAENLLFEYYFLPSTLGLKVLEVPKMGQKTPQRFLKHGREFFTEDLAMRYLSKYIRQGGYSFYHTRKI